MQSEPFPAVLYGAVERHSYPLVFATISGAHLYGFPSPDSDYDLRGVHVLPIESFVGLDIPEETIEHSSVEENIELDLVTHDVRKFVRMMLKPNGYVLEQLYSPLVVHSTQYHEELKHLGAQCVTRHHVRHYKGFAARQWKMLQTETVPRVKTLLYLYRVLLTGIHLMRTGRIEANLVVLNHDFALPFLPDLIEQKKSGERTAISAPDLVFHEREYHRMSAELEEAAQNSPLPELPSAREELNNLLKTIRSTSQSLPE